MKVVEDKQPTFKGFLKYRFTRDRGPQLFMFGLYGFGVRMSFADENLRGFTIGLAVFFIGVFYVASWIDYKKTKSKYV